MQLYPDFDILAEKLSTLVVSSLYQLSENTWLSCQLDSFSSVPLPNLISAPINYSGWLCPHSDSKMDGVVFPDPQRSFQTWCNKEMAAVFACIQGLCCSVLMFQLCCSSSSLQQEQQNREAVCCRAAGGWLIAHGARWRYRVSLSVECLQLTSG